MSEKREVENEMEEREGYINFIFEMGMLSCIQRSGVAFLGSGEHSVAEHSFRSTMIAYVLSKLTSLPHDPYQLLCLSLFHDAHESRIGDLNNVQKDYLVVEQEKMWRDIESLSPLGQSIHSLIEEFEKKESNEAILAQDADKLELLFFLKEQHDLGNPRALEWFESSFKRLKTKEAILLGEELRHIKADEWWKKRASRIAFQ